LQGKQNSRQAEFQAQVVSSTDHVQTHQAIITAMNDKSDNKSNTKRKILCHGSDCQVKGIIFFGTPFIGSKWANWFAPFIWIKAIADPLTQVLRFRNNQLKRITNDFIICRDEKLPDLRVISCYESEPPLGFDMIPLVSSVTND
jgi:hypothetical protein